MTFIRPLLTFLLVGISLCCRGQNPFPVDPGRNAIFELLRKPQFPLPDPLEAEQLLELVQTQVTDSLVTKRWQRLRFPLSSVVQLFGLRWERVAESKQRFIGTYSRHMKMYNGYAHEYDLNLFMVPHIQRYIDLQSKALDITRDRNRKFEDVKCDSVPYPCPPELQYNGKCIAVECEVTPSDGAQEVLPDVILPIMTGTHDAVEHSSFGTTYPSVGVQGVWCLDCNHNCRPEIHPIELMWWMSPGTTDSVVWNVVSLTDVSRRFPKWTGPVHAKVSIPFLHEEDVTITLQPILMNGDAVFPKDTYGVAPDKFIGTEKLKGHQVKVIAPSELFEMHSPTFSAKVLTDGSGHGYLQIEFLSEEAFAMKVLVQNKP